jgi:iron(III) transport system permease protein
MPAARFARLFDASGAWAAGVLGRMLFAVLVAAPVAALLVAAGQGLARDGLAALATMWPGVRRTLVLAHSIAFAGAVASGTMLAGTLIALGTWHRGARAAAVLQWGVWSLAALPPYVHALAWSAFAHGARLGLQAAGIAVATPSGWTAAFWVESMAMLPLATALAGLALASIERPLLEAARTQRADDTVWWRIALPLAAPMLAAGTGVLFVLVLTDYSVPSLFGLTTYPLEVFAEFSASNDPIRALAVAVPALAVGAAVLVFLQAALRDAASRPARDDRPWHAPPQWSPPIALAQRLALALLAAACTVLLASLLIEIGSPAHFVDTLVAARAEIGVSLRVAAGTALVCLPPAVAMAGALQRQGPRGAAGWAWVTVPFAIPAPLQGVGLVALWNRPLGVELYGTEAMLVLAGAARFAPIAALLVLAQMRRVDPALVDAARLLRPGALRTLLSIRLPLLAPGLLAAFGATFALTLGELGASLIVTPPGSATLTLRIYNYLHFGALQDVAALCLVLVAVAALVGFLALSLARAWARLCGDTGART